MLRCQRYPFKCLAPSPPSGGHEGSISSLLKLRSGAFLMFLLLLAPQPASLKANWARTSGSSSLPCTGCWFMWQIQTSPADPASPICPNGGKHGQTRPAKIGHRGQHRNVQPSGRYQCIMTQCLYLLVATCYPIPTHKWDRSGML